LQSASREDLVAFIRKQNEHVKKLEALNKAAKAKQEVDFKSEADELRLQIAQQKKGMLDLAQLFNCFKYLKSNRFCHDA
jgi:hypothetical protein